MKIPDVQKVKATLTTDASGDATNTDFGPFRGYLDKIIYTKVDFATGVDFTITEVNSGETIWTQNNQDASIIKRPGDLVQDTAGADTTQYDRMWIEGDISVVVASGGNTKTGTFEIVCIAE